MIVNEKKICSDFSKIKKLAHNALKKQKYSLSMEYMEYAANLMYNSNVIFEDSDLEKNIEELSLLVSNNIDLPVLYTQDKRIVFYDYFVYDNRGLTEQYLEALEQLGYRVLFISNVNPSKSSELIFAKVLSNPHFEVCFLNEKDPLLRSKELAERVISFGARSVLCHTSPWDISGLVAMHSLAGKMTRFLINLTDHAFWLGTKSFDFYFEFRSFGFNISEQYRHIDEKKLLYLPFYPIVNTNVEFNGFDFDTIGKKLLFSGGSLAKIQGSNVFLDLVKYILDEYPDVIFLYLGNGDSSFIEKFIKVNKFENRFFYSKERKDIFQVFKHCYFYLNTYPVTGGLMTQYACICGKPPLTLNDKNDHDDDISEMMPFCDSKGVIASSLDELKKNIDLYLTDENAYLKVVDSIKNGVISEEKFANLLGAYLDNPVNLVNANRYEIDRESLFDSYINRLNEDKGLPYCNLFLKKNIVFAIKFFRYSSKALLHRVCSKLMKK